MKARLALAVTPLALMLPLAGCGDAGPGSDLARIAPAGSVLYLEGAVLPNGELKENVDLAAEKIAGVENLGEFVASELESAAGDSGEPFDYEEEVEPWLGERAAVVFVRIEGDDAPDPMLALQSTDTEATQEFIDSQVGHSEDSGKDQYEERSYEGISYWFDHEDNEAIGLIGDTFVVAQGKRQFMEAVDANDGEALGDEDRFTETFANASEDALVDAYFDISSMLEQGDAGIDESIERELGEAGIDLEDLTAVASLVPGADQVEIDIRSELPDLEPQDATAPELLASLPGDSFAALAISGLGMQLREALDAMDEERVPASTQPAQLDDVLGGAGIDLEALAGSLEDAGVFAIGENERGLGGALVLTSKDSEAADAVADLGQLLRNAEAPGVTTLKGKLDGFSVRDPELGRKPLVVAAEGKRVAIAYGREAALLGLGAASSGRALSDNPVYDDAVASLDGTPIVAFADGPAALELADSLIPASDSGFEEAKRYLRSISFLALGAGSETEPTDTKLVVGLR